MTVFHFTPLDVTMWAFFGSLVSMLARLPTDRRSRHWLIGSAVHLTVRTLVGIAGSAYFSAAGFGVLHLHVLANVPPWALAFVVASSNVTFWPVRSASRRTAQPGRE